MSFITQSWYAALWADELRDAPIRKTYLDNPVVLYRGAAGQPIALADSCPHRFAPLSRGKLHGDAIGCPYHGLRFGADGRCVHNPHGPVPSVARVRSYPLREHAGLLWIWMGTGDPEPSLPDVELLTDDSWAWVHESLSVKGNYQLVIDNLLDLTHVDFMHPFLSRAAPNPCAIVPSKTVSESSPSTTAPRRPPEPSYTPSGRMDRRRCECGRTCAGTRPPICTWTSASPGSRHHRGRPEKSCLSFVDPRNRDDDALFLGRRPQHAPGRSGAVRELAHGRADDLHQ